MTKFRELAIGQTFDFVNDEKPGLNSFFHRCVKVSARTYRTVDGSREDFRAMRVGTINCEVHHVDVPDEDEWPTAHDERLNGV